MLKLCSSNQLKGANGVNGILYMYVSEARTEYCKRPVMVLTNVN